MALNWDVLEKNEKIGFKSSSSTVIPTRSEISQLALTGNIQNERI